MAEAIPTSKTRGHEKLILSLTTERSHKEAYRAESPELTVSIDRLSEMAGGAHDLEDPDEGSRADFRATLHETDQLLIEGMGKAIRLAEEKSAQ
jgi:hypothetical protein